MPRHVAHRDPVVAQALAEARRCVVMATILAVAAASLIAAIAYVTATAFRLLAIFGAFTGLICAILLLLRAAAVRRNAVADS